MADCGQDQAQKKSQPFEDSQPRIGLPQLQPLRRGQGAEFLDRRQHQFGVRRMRYVLWLHRGIDRDPRQITRLQGSGRVRHRRQRWPPAIDIPNGVIGPHDLGWSVALGSSTRRSVYGKLRALAVL
jgi:hypothetical protein